MKIQSYNIDMFSNRDFRSQDFRSGSYIENSTMSASYKNDPNGTEKTYKIGDQSTEIFIRNMEMLAKTVQKTIDFLKGIKEENSRDFTPASFDNNMVATYSEKESTKVHTKAKIKADGKMIDVDLKLNLSRSFTQLTHITQVRQMYDPLVITLDGAMPTLSNNTIEFDIDADGRKDQISRLGANSAFLVLDLNENGVVDDANELFGAKSGDGYADLTKYDKDSNGWIDENDEIFNKLRIWQNDEDGKRLLSLGEVGIGAIFLGSISSQHSYKALDDNANLAELKRSGFFLFENGNAGVMAQMDFAKISKNKDDVVKKETQQNLTRLGVELPKQEQLDINPKSSLIKILENRLANLQSQLLKAKNSEKMSINMQIAVVSSELMTAKMMGFS
ncbi:hypothetical protein LMG7974_00870 [Campylobacter majalis]|uniref:Uncharacterized protein n=1 Tax=Campylobacter majalis TaxID=2790656 RepID=A0ABN7KBF3_9BACT|nr:hypothetical protein [Campylobacter majalis]CAD7288172.1 hypothetical protein LMG7974_00870 [Campylobacter majalis]